jgi:hypothetical protein
MAQHQDLIASMLVFVGGEYAPKFRRDGELLKYAR